MIHTIYRIGTRNNTLISRVDRLRYDVVKVIELLNLHLLIALENIQDIIRARLHVLTAFRHMYHHCKLTSIRHDIDKGIPRSMCVCEFVISSTEDVMDRLADRGKIIAIQGPPPS